MIILLALLGILFGGPWIAFLGFFILLWIAVKECFKTSVPTPPKNK